MSDFPTQLAFDDALAIIRDVGSQHRLETETLPLSRTHGRILATDVHATIALPPFDNSAMDGFALRHADLREGETTLRLMDEQFAGRARDITVSAGECVRITTGAPMPPGADTVVIRENTRVEATREGDRVVILASPGAGANVRHVGEDVQVGECLLHAGQTLTPARVSLAASLGVPSLTVFRKPTVAVFSSGDELVEPGLSLAPGEIYDSNRELLMGLLRAEGLEPTAWPRLADDPKQVEIALRDAGCAFDLIVTCGAVSAGEKDHIPAVLQQFGQVHFWKVRMKPGMPVLFGSLDQARVLALPGNPVSVFATFLGFGRTLIDALQGRTEPRQAERAQLVAPVEKSHARREFMRAKVFCDEHGVLRADANPAVGSHRLRAVGESNALIVIPDGPQRLAAGTVVEILRYA